MSELKHTKFLASDGTNGWYTTVTDNEVIDFGGTINSITIEAWSTTLKIKLGNNASFWYIDANSQDGITGLQISSIQVNNPAGTKIRWKALKF